MKLFLAFFVLILFSHLSFIYILLLGGIIDEQLNITLHL